MNHRKSLLILGMKRSFWGAVHKSGESAQVSLAVYPPSSLCCVMLRVVQWCLSPRSGTVQCCYIVLILGVFHDLVQCQIFKTAKL